LFFDFFKSVSNLDLLGSEQLRVGCRGADPWRVRLSISSHMLTANLHMANLLTASNHLINMDNNLHNSQDLDSIKQELLTRQLVLLNGHHMFSRSSFFILLLLAF
jgi:hypothetical protein